VEVENNITLFSADISAKLIGLGAHIWAARFRRALLSDIMTRKLNKFGISIILALCFNCH
jgi:hypothetical protein